MKSIKYILSFIALSLLLLSSFSFAKGPIDLADFHRSEVSLADGAVHASTETSVYIRKSDKSRWIVKENPKLWTINEFISSKLYRHVLGHDVVSETILAKNKNGQVVFATKALTGLKPFNFKTRKAEGIPFSCVFNSKPGCPGNIIGGELAALTSLWLDDGDVFEGNNYGLLRDTNGDYIVTRFDFDDSLKFFERNEIAKLVVPSNVPPQLYEMAANMLRHDMKGHGNCDFAKLKGLYDLKPNALQRAEFLDAFRTLEGVDLEMIKIIVASSVAELRDYFSGSELEAIYTFSYLPKQIQSLFSSADIYMQLETYLIDVLMERYHAIVDLGRNAAAKSGRDISQDRKMVKLEI